MLAPEMGHLPPATSAIEYVQREGALTGDALAAQIQKLYEQVFTPEPAVDIARFLADKRAPFTLAALAGGIVVGFKLGYERKPGQFYSWLGAVSPENRRQGIAAELMTRQHEWARARGYRSIRTKTKNTWKAMLVLNLRHGFDIIGMSTTERGTLKLILERRLT